MSKFYSIGDLYVGMKIKPCETDEVWEIEEINLDYDFVMLIVVQTHRARLGHHICGTYVDLINSLNEGYYIDVLEENFRITIGI